MIAVQMVVNGVRSVLAGDCRLRVIAAAAFDAALHHGEASVHQQLAREACASDWNRLHGGHAPRWHVFC